MQTRYLPDATDFTDMEKRPVRDGHVECPKCHGYGGWNLLLNEYRGDTPAQRHFRSSCGQCWGWGDVKGLDATCIHEYKQIAPDQPFRCWHTIQCTKCGTTKSYSNDD